MGEQRAGRAGWVGDMYRIVKEIFPYPWHEHIRDLNTRLGTAGDSLLSSHGPGEPPTFFNGDIEALESGRWTLAISLNPHQVAQPGPPIPPPVPTFGTPTDYWNFWRTYNSDTWYPGFYRPLVRMAAGALGDEAPRDAERTYATTRMLFLELCPYASPRFALPPKRVAELLEGDYGFRVARRIFHLATEGGEPALILVNGNAAMAAMEAMNGARVQWRERVYSSPSKPDKRLHHWQGGYRTARGRVPIAGFPFLHTMKGHNSNAEIAQLGDALCGFVSDFASDAE